MEMSKYLIFYSKKENSSPNGNSASLCLGATCLIIEGQENKCFLVAVDFKFQCKIQANIR